MLSPEQTVVLQIDPDLANGHIKGYLRFPNYPNNLRRLGTATRERTEAVTAWLA